MTDTDCGFFGDRGVMVKFSSAVWVKEKEGTRGGRVRACCVAARITNTHTNRRRRVCTLASGRTCSAPGNSQPACNPPSAAASMSTHTTTGAGGGAGAGGGGGGGAWSWASDPAWGVAQAALDSGAALEQGRAAGQVYDAWFKHAVTYAKGQLPGGACHCVCVGVCVWVCAQQNESSRGCVHSRTSRRVGVCTVLRVVRGCGCGL